MTNPLRLQNLVIISFALPILVMERIGLRGSRRTDARSWYEAAAQAPRPDVHAECTAGLAARGAAGRLARSERTLLLMYYIPSFRQFVVFLGSFFLALAVAVGIVAIWSPATFTDNEFMVTMVLIIASAFAMTALFGGPSQR